MELAMKNFYVMFPTIHKIPAFAKGKVPHRHVERGFPVFATLHLRVLVRLALKLAKVIKISHCETPTITQKCCWPSLLKHLDKNTKKLDLSVYLYLTG